MTEYVPPHVISVLKTYQDKAPRSLHGPGLSLVHPSKAGAIVVGRSETPDLPHASGASGGGAQQHGAHHHEHGRDEDGVGVVQSQPPARQQQQPLGPPVPGVPIMTTPDPDCGIVQMTVLEGKRIGCFLLGGETRLCLPQIFNNILMDFSVEQINRSIQELMIYLYNCTDQQLQEFKRANIIPDTAKTCGLITRTNAERLCSSLLHQAHELRPRLKGGGGGGVMNGSFRVYHRCFGKGEGLFLPELYSFEEPTCIECAECRGLFSPQKFVCHQHEPQEIRTCHWGFNSSNWRSYIHVAEAEKNRDEHALVLDKIWQKEREFEQELECERAFWIARRKAAFEDGGTLAIKAEPLDIPLKKPKLMSDVGALYHSGCGSGTSRSQHNATQLLVQAHHHAYHHQQQAQLQQQQTSAAFRPWTAQQKAQKYAQQQQQALLLQQIGPYANGTTTTIVNGTIRATSPGGSILTLSSQEPPLLQNPENVVPMSEKDKFERSYQPNVALVPRKSILCGKDSSSSSAGGQQRRDYDDKERSVIKCEVVQIKQESPPTPPTTSSSSSASGRCPSTGSAAMHEGTVMRSVIKCDVQIKQERPGTPPPPGSGQMEHGRRTGSATGGDSSRSPGPPPTSHIPVTSPPSGGGSLQHQGAITISTIIAKHHVSSMGGSAYGGGSNSNSPVPLDAQQHSGSSGSNEITSSTSPLPPAPIVVSMGTLNGACIGGDGTPGSGIDKPKLVLIKEPISPPVGARTASVRHSPHGHLLQQQQQQQQHGLAASHHSQQGSSSSPPPPSHHGDHHQPLYMHHHQVLHQQQQQQHHHYRSHHGGVAGTIIHRNGGLATVGNSEFELSTDTDDDSQAGEPDSSNAPSTVELIGEVLKEVEPETKQQILDIFKVLLQESRVEHHRLQMEIRAKEDQMVDVQRQKDHLQQQVHQLQHELDRALLKIDSLREHHHQLTAQQHHHHHHHHQQQQHHIMVRDTLNGAGESSTSSTPPSPLSLVSNGSNSNHSHHQPIERRNSFPEKSEIIMKPLKKLLRRSPDDSTTVLMLASPPPQPPVSVTLPSTLPACLSITATSIPVAPKESFIQRDTDASSEDTVRRQRCSSAGSSTSPPLPSTVSQGGPLVPPSTPSLLPPPAQQQTPPTSATNVPASPTTITTVVSAVNDGAPATTTASSTSTTKSLEKEDPVTPPVSPNVVVIPVGGGPTAPSSEGTVASPSSPRPPSRVTSPESDRHANGATVASDHEDNVDEDEPMPEAPAVVTSPAVDGESVSSPTGASSAVKSPTTDTVVNAPNKVTGTTSSAATTIVSNQDQKDSPSRTKGERTCDGSSSSNNTSTSNSTGGKSSCDN